MTSTTPLTVGRLFDGNQLVKRVLIEYASKIIQTNDTPPQRLRELDDAFHEGDAHRTIPFSVWKHTAWSGTDYIDYDEWMREFGPKSPPLTAIVLRKDRPAVVVVRYADYQRQGSRIG